MKKLKSLLILCMAILAIACSDKSEEPNPEDNMPLRPITPGFPPIRPRVNAEVPLMCNIKSGTMSVPVENGVKTINVTFSAADSIVWECTVTADANRVRLPDLKGRYTVLATTDQGCQYIGEINL